MRRSILVVILLFKLTLVMAKDHPLYYDMTINTNLFSIITLTALNTSTEKLFHQSTALRIHSISQNRHYDMPISSLKNLTALKVLPFAEDWLVLGSIINNKLDKRLAHSNFLHQRLSNIKFTTSYLSSQLLNEDDTQADKRYCSFGKLRVSSASNPLNKKHLFILLTTGESEKFVSQYYGAYKKKVDLDCFTDHVYIRQAIF